MRWSIVRFPRNSSSGTPAPNCSTQVTLGVPRRPWVIEPPTSSRMADTPSIPTGLVRRSPGRRSESVGRGPHDIVAQLTSWARLRRVGGIGVEDRPAAANRDQRAGASALKMRAGRADARTVVGAARSVVARLTGRRRRTTGDCKNLRHGYGALSRRVQSGCCPVWTLRALGRVWGHVIVDGDKLSELLSEFPRTLLTDFPI